MSAEVPADLWKKLTSTVGLVCVRHRGATNLMSAEWSYFVNKAPLYAAVVLGPRATTRELIAAAGEFTVTFCSEEQSELADFAGSFSTADVDKTTSDLVRLGEPEATGSPWVRGGLTAVECTLRQTVAFPVHTMYVGEVVAAHTPDPLPGPLVKHGAMHRLGGPAERTAAVVAAQLLPGGQLRVAATGPPDAGGPWRLSLLIGGGPDARAETAETDALDTLDAIDLG
ncbi:flavin reductase family protein, partial [Streptomyces nanshensis]|uniref:flavin reductase family protein n=1 Tax=Streptomyces nanshensis TaxID=518642 RepID=UPI00085CAAD3